MKWDKADWTTAQTEVEAWDVTAASALFKVAKSALLDDEDEFFDGLPAALEEDNGLDYYGLATWPLFRSMRDAPGYQEFRSQHEAEFSLAALHGEAEEEEEPVHDSPEASEDVRSVVEGLPDWDA